MPHPATAVKSRGPRSRAGFMGYPQFRPMDTPMAKMIKPMHRGSMPLGAPIFFLSVMARMHRTNEAVAMTFETERMLNRHAYYGYVKYHWKTSSN